MIGGGCVKNRELGNYLQYTRMCRARENIPHHIFDHTTNDVTTHHCFVRPRLLSPRGRSFHKLHWSTT